MTVKIDGSNGLLANYDYQTPTTGFSYTFTTYNVLFAVPAGTLATGTVTMSATPVDGTTVTITTTQQITALTINANTGQSIIGGGAIQLNANTSRQYLYRAANTTWYLVNVAAGAVVTSVVAGSGISVSAATGAVTISTTGGGTVTSIATGNGLSGGTITTSGTLTIAAPTFNSVGSYVEGYVVQLTALSSGSSVSAGGGNNQVQAYSSQQTNNNLSGTWRVMGGGAPANGCGLSFVTLFVRVS
jgi:hypothetical protein